jgi:hypothetical protein
MTSLANKQIEIRATSARMSNDALIVDLTDGRTVLAPLAWYPRLLRGARAEGDKYQFIARAGLVGKILARTAHALGVDL